MNDIKPSLLSMHKYKVNALHMPYKIITMTTHSVLSDRESELRLEYSKSCHFDFQDIVMPCLSIRLILGFVPEGVIHVWNSSACICRVTDRNCQP